MSREKFRIRIFTKMDESIVYLLSLLFYYYLIKQLTIIILTHDFSFLLFFPNPVLFTLECANPVTICGHVYR